MYQMFTFPPNLRVGALPAGAPERRNQALKLTNLSDPSFVWKADLESRFRLLKHHCHHRENVPQIAKPGRLLHNHVRCASM